MITLQPIVRAILDARDDAIVVFDAHSRLIYLNAAARSLFPDTGDGPTTDDGPMPSAQRAGWLLTQGFRTVPITYGGALQGTVLYVSSRPVRTLADREDEAIHETLKRTSGRLAEAARRLGISRTTLWRRLRKERKAASLA